MGKINSYFDVRKEIMSVDNKMQDIFIKEVLIAVAYYDLQSSIYWKTNFNFYIDCSDLFFWGASDLEPLIPENFATFIECMEIAGSDGPLLFCAKVRECRPQKAFYQYFSEENKVLFDACGPERELGPGNPG
jgi:hypothetical protein